MNELEKVVHLRLVKIFDLLESFNLTEDQLLLIAFQMRELFEELDNKLAEQLRMIQR